MTHVTLSKQSRTSQPTVCELNGKYLGIFEISKNMAHVPLPNQSHTYQPQPTVFKGLPGDLEMEARDSSSTEGSQRLSDVEDTNDERINLGGKHQVQFFL